MQTFCMMILVKVLVSVEIAVAALGLEVGRIRCVLVEDVGLMGPRYIRQRLEKNDTPRVGSWYLPSTSSDP